MMTRKTHSVTVVYPFTDVDSMAQRDGAIKRAIRRVHRTAQFAGSGAGFGERDIEFHVRGAKSPSPVRIKREIDEERRIPGLRVEVFDENGEISKKPPAPSVKERRVK